MKLLLSGSKTMATLVNYTCKSFIKLKPASSFGPVICGHLSFLKNGNSCIKIESSSHWTALLCFVYSPTASPPWRQADMFCISVWNFLPCTVICILCLFRVTTMLYFNETIYVSFHSLFSKARLLFSSWFQETLLLPLMPGLAKTNFNLISLKQIKYFIA